MHSDTWNYRPALYRHIAKRRPDRNHIKSLHPVSMKDTEHNRLNDNDNRCGEKSLQVLQNQPPHDALLIDRSQKHCRKHREHLVSAERRFHHFIVFLHCVRADHRYDCRNQDCQIIQPDRCNANHCHRLCAQHLFLQVLFILP